MRRSIRLTLTTLVAALVLGAAAGTTSATKLTITNTSIRAVWQALTFTAKAGGAGVSCVVTMEGTFHSRTLAKSEGALIGNITRAIATHPCVNGDIWFHNGTENPLGLGAPATSLPWHIVYQGFTGTLPNLTGMFVRINGMTTTVRSGFCLERYGNATEERVFFFTINGAGTVTTFEPEVAHLIKRRGALSALCPEPARLSQAAPVTLLASTATIGIRLI